MTLDQVKKGSAYIIKFIPAGKIASQAIRFGVYKGETVSIGEIIPMGPIIIYKNRQEIAIGRSLAKKIEIEPILQEVS